MRVHSWFGQSFYVPDPPRAPCTHQHFRAEFSNGEAKSLTCAECGRVFRDPIVIETIIEQANLREP